MKYIFNSADLMPQLSQILTNLTVNEIVDLIRYAITEDDLIRDITEAYLMGKSAKTLTPNRRLERLCYY